MAQLPVHPPQADSYRNFRFRLKWDGRYVAGVSKVSALRQIAEVTGHCQDGDPCAHGSPGAARYEPISIARGVTHDAAFAAWASKAHSLGADPGSAAALRDVRRDIILELVDEVGQPVIAYRIFGCWPSDYSAMPDLDPTAPGVAIQKLVLQHEGWARDSAVAEPAEPR